MIGYFIVGIASAVLAMLIFFVGLGIGGLLTERKYQPPQSRLGQGLLELRMRLARSQHDEKRMVELAKLSDELIKEVESAVEPPRWRGSS